MASRRVSFIKCDIEGGEEEIIQDILEYAYENQVIVYLSFHLSWWQNQEMQKYADLFSLFNVTCPELGSDLVLDPCTLIETHPFGSLLFTPL